MGLRVAGGGRCRAPVAVVAALTLFAAIVGGWLLPSAFSATGPDQTVSVPTPYAGHADQALIDKQDALAADETLLKITRVKRDRPPAGVQVGPSALGLQSCDTRFSGDGTEPAVRDILTRLCVARR